MRISSKNDINEEERLMMTLFLDFLSKNALKNLEQLISYTQEMSNEINNLLMGVEVEE